MIYFIAGLVTGFLSAFGVMFWVILSSAWERPRHGGFRSCKPQDNTRPTGTPIQGPRGTGDL